MSIITWIHLSDLHFRTGKEHTWDENIVLKALLADVAEQIERKDLLPDFVAITGDVAFSGKPEEYELARLFLDDLLETTGLAKDRLFIVPGNHDVDRKLITRGAKGIGNSLQDRESTNAVLATPSDRKLMLARLDAYAAFVNQYLGPNLVFDDEQYFYVRSLDLASLRVGILGLNTAWLCASDADKNYGVLIGERQARTALRRSQEVDLRIALMHHPFDWLRDFDQDDSAALLLDNCDFILHGHLHRTTAKQLLGPDSDARVFASGACYQTRRYPNLYSFVQVDLRANTGSMHLRRYSDVRGGFWTSDTQSYKSVADGVYRFSYHIPKHTRKSPAHAVDDGSELSHSLPSINLTTQFRSCREDWQVTVDLSTFHGRQEELSSLRTWILTDRCRLVALLGIGGVGKTSLAAKLAEQIKDQFDYLFWRDLRNPRPIDEILAECVAFLSDQKHIALPKAVDGQISLLIEHLQRNRCLLILDNAESILQEGTLVGQYRSGYEQYGRLMQRVGEAFHQSCLVVTSRERFREVIPLAWETLPTRSLLLSGLDIGDAQRILQEHNLKGTRDAWAYLVYHYAGNPLALKLAAAAIQDSFNGDLDMFSDADTMEFVGIHELLEQQFERLSPSERDIMYWLAIEREPVSPDELLEDIIPPMTRGDNLAILDALGRRSLVEFVAPLLTLQPVVLEYVTKRLIEKLAEEIRTRSHDLLASHLLLKAQAKDYVRQSQLRCILDPLREQLLSSMDSADIERSLLTIQSAVRQHSRRISNYIGGNTLNLLSHLGYSLNRRDFSRMAVWQAYLQGVDARDVDFSYSDLKGCVFTSTFGLVLSLAFSPDGRLIAAGTSDGQVRVWKASDGNQILTCSGHKDWVRSVAFSPDGSMLASGCDDRTIAIWSVSTGQCMMRLEGHIGRIRSVVFNPEATILASGSEDRTLRLWDLDTGQTLVTISGYTSCLAFSPSGNLLASVGDDRDVHLWDATTGQNAGSLIGHVGRIRVVAFSPDGSILAAGGDDQNVRVWDVHTRQCLGTLQGHTGWIRSIAFSSDGSLLASGGEDQVVRLWDLTTGRCLKTMQGHTAAIWAIDFEPKDDILASGGEDQTIRFWDVRSGRCSRVLRGHTSPVWSVAFNTDGSLLADCGSDQNIRIWDMRTAECQRIFQGHTDHVWAVAFHPHSNLLASGGSDQTVRLWMVKTGQCSRTLTGHANPIWSVTFSPDGGTLLSAGEDQTARLWDVTSGRCLRVLQHTDRLWDAGFSPDGTIVATGGSDHIVRLWDIGVGRCFTALQGHTNTVESVVFSPDGRLLASGSEDHTVRLWDIATGQCLKILKDHSGPVWSVAFDPDCRILVSGSGDRTAKVWDVNTGQCLRTLHTHDSTVRTVAFSPDGIIFASGSDQSIDFWNVETGDCLNTFRSERPYERMNITGVRGLTSAQRSTLKTLGAIENLEDAHM